MDITSLTLSPRQQYYYCLQHERPMYERFWRGDTIVIFRQSNYILTQMIMRKMYHYCHCNNVNNYIDVFVHLTVILNFSGWHPDVDLLYMELPSTIGLSTFNVYFCQYVL